MNRQVQPPATGVGVVLVNERDQMLLGRRCDSAAWRACWSLPGGWIEPGETPQFAARREVYEETGLTCHSVALLGVFSSRVRAGVATTVGAIATDWSGTVRCAEPDNFDTWSWFNRGDVPTDLFPPTADLLAMYTRMQFVAPHFYPSAP